MGKPLRIALPLANAFLMTILERRFLFFISFLPKGFVNLFYLGVLGQL